MEIYAPERGDWVPVTDLSQGTLDVVYLAARIGLVRLVTGDRRPPILLDDPFVTLDDARAARALELLRDLSTDFQVIYLTTSDRYDALAERVIVLEGPTAVDLPPSRRGWPLPEVAGPVAVLALGLISAASWGAGDFGGGLLSRRAPLFGVVFGMQLIGMVAALAIGVARGEPIPRGPTSAWAVAAGGFGVVGITSLYRGLSVGRMGVVAPTTGVLAAVVPVVVRVRDGRDPVDRGRRGHRRRVAGRRAGHARARP